MLNIIIENSGRYKDSIEKLCKATGIVQYKIIDPISYDLNHKFKTVLVCGTVKKKINAWQIWHTKIPDSNLDPASKMQIFKEFKKVAAWLRSNQTTDTAKNEDIPKLKTLNEFFDSLNHEIVEIILDDGRLLGIYPDDEPLKMKYDLEYHASIILNLSRIAELIPLKKISIKEM